jgi:hypothetical protein
MERQMVKGTWHTRKWQMDIAGGMMPEMGARSLLGHSRSTIRQLRSTICPGGDFPANAA